MPRAWSLISRPAGVPVSDNFALIDLPSAPLGEGQVRVANRWLSVDPYMRGRMNDIKSYVPPFALGAPMEGGAIGAVIESRAPALPVGTKLLHMAGWREEAVLDAGAAQPLPDHPGVDDQAYLGQFGMPGMTAYFGLLDVAAAKAGDVVFVSAAAGAVGSTVVQIAKAKGMTVIGAAGGADKCAWVASIGADHVVDYKAGSVARALMAAAPDGIDVYFDNVGGEHLDAALLAARMRARFAICGMIDVYNDGKPQELRYLSKVIGARINIRGFIVSDFMDRAAEFHRDMALWQQQGRLKREETVFDGIETMPDAFLGLFTGGNTGKMLVRL